MNTINTMNNMNIKTMINQNELKQVKEWIKSHGNINEIFDGDTALSYAVGRGNLDVVKLLIEHHANVNICSPLVPATYQCNFEILKHLIVSGADVNVTFEDQNDNKASLLGYAFEKEYFEMAALFIENGADVNIHFDYDRKRYNPLAYSLETGRLEMARFLIEHGADINITFEYGHCSYTPLSYSIEKGDIEMVKLLFSLGAVIPKGKLLINAVGEANLEIAKILLQHRAKPSDIYIANSLLRDGIHKEINFIMLQNFKEVTISGEKKASVIYGINFLVSHSFIIKEILKLNNVHHCIPSEVINELDILSKSDNEEIKADVLKINRILFELPVDTFEIIDVETTKTGSDKIIETIKSYSNNADTEKIYICSEDDLFKVKVKHLNNAKIDFLS